MKNIESKVFVGIRVIYAAFAFILLLNFGGRMTRFFILNVLGIFLASLIAVNYEKGKNWARIWMFIANYGGALLLIKDISDFGKLTSYSRFETWANFGIVVDIACIIGSVYVIIQLHKIKSDFLRISPGKKEDPEQVMQQLKNMLDQRAITQEEYEKKKAEILERM